MIYIIEEKDLDVFARLKCSICDGYTSLQVIKKMYAEGNTKWHGVINKRGIICGLCFEGMYDIETSERTD